MTTISLFTPISYVRPKSYTEGALSTLSNYFYLGGNRAKVIRNDEVRLESEKIPWYTIALKVASYVLLFPLTLTLLAINFVLRYQHNFTVISPSTKPRKALNTESNFTPQKEFVSLATEKRQDVDKDFSTTLSKEQAQVISPTLSTQKSDEEPFLEVHQKPKETPHSITTVTAQNVENVRQQVLVSLSLTEDLFQPSEKSLPAISPFDEIEIPVKYSEKIFSHNKEVEPILLDKEAEPLSLKEFKKKLKYFDTFDKNLNRIAKDLFKIAPKTLELTEIAHLIFEHYSKHAILLLLDAILIAHPSFTLSAYDKIRKAIVEDEEHALNNSSLITLLKEHTLDTDEEKLTACYDLAYRFNHPYIYRLSRTPILSSDYSLNFLWVNLNPQDRIKDTAQNIFGNGLDSSENADCIKDPKALRAFEKNEESLEKENLENWKKIKKSFAYRISKWADVNPGAQINLWYDSALVTQKAQQKTFEMMKGISESRGVNLKLKDIRQLPNIGGEIGNSLHPGTQVYYRVDLLKALIADHMISSEESAKYCVVSDIDVEPMSPQQMLDQRTVDYLSSTGYVFNRVSLLGDFENSFFIFNKENENLKKVHHETIIKGTAANITLLRQYPIGTRLRPDYILDAQFVFRQYSNFRRRMKELDDKLANPRKAVKCPESQFNFGGNFSKSAYQAEIFRFIGDSNIPYTINGRNFENYGEGQIEKLMKWKAEPLLLVE